MLARIERRLRYEIARRSRDRRSFKSAIDEAQSVASAYCAGLGLDGVLGKSSSTGAGLTDYYLLHRYVVTRKPALVIEFGSGKSSIILAHALKLTGGHLITYEDIEEYHRNIVSIIPEDLKRSVTAIHASAVEAHFDGIPGVRYSAKPPVGAQLIFVDGPTEVLKNGTKGACLDLLFYLREHPTTWLAAIIDQKFSSQEAYQSVLPPGLVRYDPVMDIGFIPGVCGALLQRPQRHWRIKHGSSQALLALL